MPHALVGTAMGRKAPVKRQARERLEGIFPGNGFAHPEIPCAELGLWLVPSSKADYFPAIIEERGLSALAAQLIPEDPAL
jgi:hypothetical protein